METDSSLETAEGAHQAILCAVTLIEAARCRLLYDLRLLSRAAPIGEFQGRVEAVCVGGGCLFEAISKLRAEAEADPAGSLSS